MSFGGFSRVVIFESRGIIVFEVMKSGHGSKTGEFIQTYVRLKPLAIDELSSVNATKREVAINRSANDHFEYSR